MSFKLGVALGVVTATVIMAGTASATVLYSGSTKLGVGTITRSSLTASEILETTGGTVLDTCTGGEIEAEIVEAGSSVSTVRKKVKKHTRSGCTKETKTLEAGIIELHWIPNTINATVTWTGSFTINGLFENESCVYGSGTPVDIGTFSGSAALGALGKLLFAALIKRLTGSGFLCPAEVRWTAEYSVTSPTPIHATGS